MINIYLFGCGIFKANTASHFDRFMVRKGLKLTLLLNTLLPHRHMSVSLSLSHTHFLYVPLSASRFLCFLASIFLHLLSLLCQHARFAKERVGYGLEKRKRFEDPHDKIFEMSTHILLPLAACNSLHTSNSDLPHSVLLPSQATCNVPVSLQTAGIIGFSPKRTEEIVSPLVQYHTHINLATCSSSMSAGSI